MSTATSLDDPSVLATQGELIYAEAYKEKFESEYPGQFAAIDLTTRDAYVAAYPEEAVQKARSQKRNCVLHLVRIGSKSAYRMSSFFASDDADMARCL